jgi:hypothetical protein
MKWIEALKVFNQGKGTWCIARKGTPEYDEVKRIMNSSKPEAVAKRNEERGEKVKEQLKEVASASSKRREEAKKKYAEKLAEMEHHKAKAPEPAPVEKNERRKSANLKVVIQPILDAIASVMDKGFEYSNDTKVINTVGIRANIRHSLETKAPFHSYKGNTQYRLGLRGEHNGWDAYVDVSGSNITTFHISPTPVKLNDTRWEGKDYPKYTSVILKEIHKVFSENKKKLVFEKD